VKHVLGGGPRGEHHRPLSAYRRAFFDAGFRVDAEQTIEGVDTDRFEAVSEHVLFELTPHRDTARRGQRGEERCAPLAGLTVLSYHRIADASARDPSIELHRARGMVVSKAAFAAQMRAIGRAFEPVRLEDVHRAATGRGVLPRRAVWLTFDDGYRDVLDAVAPVMARERVPATLFVRAPERDGLPSWAPLDLCYQALARTGLDDALARVPQGEERERLLSAPWMDQIREAAALATRLGVDLRALQRGDLYLRESELDELTAQGFSLGVHGTEHVRWTTLDDGALTRALAVSADWLGHRTPGSPLSVAYPDAVIDQRVATAAARCGFTLGLLLEAPAPEGLDPWLSVRRRIARDQVDWIEQLVSEVELS
jgi:peptidoglycan/xylan/chitin deacetylase (PgdA/CDA1 family)